MKVITQLIRHFWQNGLLSREETQYLLGHGFVRPHDVPGHEGLDEDESDERPYEPDEVVEFPSALEELEDGLRGKASGRSQRDLKAKAVTSRQLMTRARQQFKRREPALGAILALAQRLEPCESWAEGLVVLRRALRQKFHDECQGLLKSRPHALRDLWRALDLHDFFGLVARNECLGRVAQSYFALLVVEDPALLGKYGWILQHDEMQAISNLRVIHRRFLCMLGSLYRRQPQRLKLAMEGGIDPVLFWALVLLHNARRGASTEIDAAREYGPLTPPAIPIWRQAWTVAAGLDRKSLTPFLISCFSKRSEDNAQDDDHEKQPLFCPKGWHEPAESDSQ